MSLYIHTSFYTV